MHDALCPECGYPLSVEVIEDDKTWNIIINLFCEGPGEDEYVLEVNTHLCNDELKDWDNVGSKLEATMTIIHRKQDPY
ncbi:MAG: hypothetical protein ACTSO9_04770 [Candidatus Helarchaeota archaeon]